MMWIQSQKRNDLLEVIAFYSFEVNNSSSISCSRIMVIGKDNQDYQAGDYKTYERTLEIINCIKIAIRNRESVFEMPKE